MQRKQRKLEAKLKGAGQENPADIPNQKRKADNEEEVATTSTTVKRKKHRSQAV